MASPEPGLIIQAITDGATNLSEKVPSASSQPTLSDRDCLQDGIELVRGVLGNAAEDHGVSVDRALEHMPPAE